MLHRPQNPNTIEQPEEGGSCWAFIAAASNGWLDVINLLLPGACVIGDSRIQWVSFYSVYFMFIPSYETNCRALPIQHTLMCFALFQSSWKLTEKST